MGARGFGKGREGQFFFPFFFFLPLWCGCIGGGVCCGGLKVGG